jgi:hypothetical protein
MIALRNGTKGRSGQHEDRLSLLTAKPLLVNTYET